MKWKSALREEQKGGILLSVVRCRIRPEEALAIVHDVDRVVIGNVECLSRLIGCTTDQVVGLVLRRID